MQQLGKPSSLRVLASILAGTGGAALENQTLLSDADPKLKHINLGLGAATGVGGAYFGWPKAIQSLLPKQLGVLGVNAAKKYIDIQQPIADKQLETAHLGRDTAALVAEKAKGVSPTDMGALGLGAAGLAGAGGLAYYLYNTLGPGKKKPQPRVTVNLPMTKNHGNIEIESDMDALSLSRRLTKSLKRDSRRQFLASAKENTIDLPDRGPRRLKGKDEKSEKQAHAIIFELPVTAGVDRVLSLLEIV